VRHGLVELDVSLPLATLDVDGPSAGVGLLLRDGGRPLGFLLLEQAGGRLTPDALEPVVVRLAAVGLLEERLRTGLLERFDAGSSGGGGAAPGQDRAQVDVTVAVCTRDRPRDLDQCLDSIERARQASGARVEVLVVDNAPPDDATREVVQRHPGVRYTREPVAGLDVARNRALAEARGQWLAYVDDDVRVDAGWLDGLARARAEHPDAAGIVGLVLPAELATTAQVRFERGGGFGRGFAQRRWDGRHGPGGRLHPLGAGVFGAGCDMAFDVDVLRSLGGFDEALDTGPPLPGGGDLDIFFRVLAAGHPLVYEPQMAVFHRHRRGTQELRRQYASWGSGFAAYLGARWADPDERLEIVRLVAWWLAYAQRQVRAAARHRDGEGVRMAWAELAGGVLGLGGYRRSQRRMAHRRAAVNQAAQ